MFPTQIIFHNLRKPNFGHRVRDLCEKLGHAHPRIVNCRVAIDQAIPATKSLQAPFSVGVEVRLRDHDVVVPRQEDADLDVALRKAFAAARKRLREAT